MNDFSTKLVNTIIEKRILIITTILVSLALSFWAMSNLKVDNDSMKSVPKTLQERIDFDKLQETFSTPFTILYIAKFQEGSIKEKCEAMESIAKKMEKIRVGEEDGIAGAYHLGRAKIPSKKGFFGLSSENIIPEKSTLTEEEIKNKLKDNRDFTQGLISDDESVLGMVLFMNPDAQRPLIIEQVTAIKDSIDAAGKIQTYMTGATTMSYFLSERMKRDFSILLPLALLISSLLLYLIFRKILFVIASLLIIAIAVIWTFAIMALTGIPLSVVTSVIPVILFPIGVADSIHVIKTYKNLRWKKGLSLKESFSKTYRELLRPIILTSITTFFGFGAFITSEISWTRHFGVFTGIGVILSLFLTVLLLPIFAYFDKDGTPPADSPEEVELDGRVTRIFRKYIFTGPFTPIFLLLVIAVSIIGIRLVKFESNPISMFSKNSVIWQSDNLISKYFGGTRFFYVVLNSEKKVNTVEQWKEIDSICKIIKSDPNIGDVSSLVPLLNRTSQLLSKKPVSKAAISLLLKGKGLFGKSFGGMINSQVDSSRTKVKLTVTAKNIAGFKYTGLAKDLKNDIEKQFPGWKVDAAGPALLIDAMINLIITTQISSLSLAFVSVFIVLLILFKSFRLGLFTTVPIILSTLFVAALMGLFGVGINTVTVIVMNTCIGIGIDYAIHFTSGYRYIRDQYDCNMDALIHTVKEKGAVIMFNTFVVGLGFLVLMFSSFPPIRSFGLFIFISMMTSSIFSLIFIPVFFKNYTKTDKK